MIRVRLKEGFDHHVHGKRYGPGEELDLPSGVADAIAWKVDIVGQGHGASGGATEREVAPAPRSSNASPAAARLAVSMGVDLESVVGSGAGGRVLVKDVQKASRA